jgi:hypothetical protein
MRDVKKSPARDAKAAPEKTGRPTLSTLLILQAVYCALGIGYNALSLALAKSGGHPLSATDPVKGMIVMLVYGACLIPAVLNYITIYRVLMALAVITLGFGGVVTHIVNLSSGRMFLYDSIVAWGVAVAINLFGLVLNVMAVLGLFRARVSDTTATRKA